MMPNGPGVEQSMTSIGIFGSRGRMGRAIAEVIGDSEGAALAGGADQGDDAGTVARASDVIVDFSSPAALAEHLAAAQAAGTAIVIGTTGLAPEHHALIDDAARTIPVLQAANTSLGVNLLAHLVRETAARLGEDWDIEIAEMHHRHKADAPSGTALMLGGAAAGGRGARLDEVSDRGRDGLTGPRQAGHIGFAALRGGAVAGDHQVIFAAEGERLELGHRADSRDIFARGAIKAAVWLNGRAPGRYTMADVLGL